MLLAFVWLIFKAAVVDAEAEENADIFKFDSEKDTEDSMMSDKLFKSPDNSTNYVCTEPSLDDLKLYDNLVYYVDGVAQVHVK